MKTRTTAFEPRATVHDEESAKASSVGYSLLSSSSSSSSTPGCSSSLHGGPSLWPEVGQVRLGEARKVTQHSSDAWHGILLTCREGEGKGEDTHYPCTLLNEYNPNKDLNLMSRNIDGFNFNMSEDSE